MLTRGRRTASTAMVRESLGREVLTLADFARLISPAAGELLESMGARSQALTRQRFGRVIRMFAPLYLSNECINNCQYCGFSRDNSILRVTLGEEEVRREARALSGQGFRNILLVAGEHPRFVGRDYLASCVKVVRDEAPSVSLEVGPMETRDYEPLVEAGADGLVVYQETYDRALYAELHTAGPSAILTGGSRLRSGPMPPGSAGWGLGRCWGWRTGGAKR
jgi:2-iminoacetate synthase